MKSNYLETLEKLQKALTVFDMSFSVSNKVFRLAIVTEILDTVFMFEQLYNSWCEHLPFGEGPDADVDFSYWKELSSWSALLDSAKQNACIDDYPVDMGNGITSDMIPTNRRKNYLKSIGSILRHSQFSGKEAASNFVKVINSDKTHMMAFGNMVFEALTPLLLILSKIETLLTNPDKSLYADYFERQKSRFDEICEENKRCILGIVNENLSNRRKCNKINALRDELWRKLYESKFLDALKEGIINYDISDYHNDHPDTGKTEEEIRELLAFEELVNNNMVPDKEKTGQHIYRHRKEFSFEDISTFFAYLHAMPIINSEIERLNREEELNTEAGGDGMAKDGEQNIYPKDNIADDNVITKESASEMDWVRLTDRFTLNKITEVVNTIGKSNEEKRIVVKAIFDTLMSVDKLYNVPYAVDKLIIQLYSKYGGNIKELSPTKTAPKGFFVKSKIPKEIAESEDWKRLMKAKIINEDGQPTGSRTEAAIIADILLERMGKDHEWTLFEKMWGRKNMRIDFQDAQNLVKYNSVRMKIISVLN